MICSRCKVDKDESEFSPSELKRRHRCKACVKEYQKLYYADLEVKEYTKRYKKEYYADPENKERTKGYHKEYYADPENKERIKGCHKQYMKLRRATDPLFKVTQNLRTLICESLKRRGYTKRSKTAQILGADFETVQRHLGPMPEYEYHIDHICPIVQAQNEEESLKLCHYTNLRYLPAEENLRKSDSKTPEGEEMCRKLLGREWIE